MLKFIAIAALVLAAPIASATECMPPLSREEASAAQSVFVFQVVSAEYRRGFESPVGDFVVARVRVVDRIRGRAATTHMSYYLGPECGPKIVLGSFYAAFLQDDRRAFVGSASNLVAIGRNYSPRERNRVVTTVATGRADAENILESSFAQLAQIPPPPPPCPAQFKQSGP